MDTFQFTDKRDLVSCILPEPGLLPNPEDHWISGSPQVEGQWKLGKCKRMVSTLKKKKIKESWNFGARKDLRDL